MILQITCKVVMGSNRDDRVKYMKTCRKEKEIKQQIIGRYVEHRQSSIKL